MRTLSLAELLNTWNFATSPSIPRSDHEHRRCRQLARAANNRMNREGFREGRDWHESDFTSCRRMGPRGRS